MYGPETTSDMRQALCAAVCAAAQHGGRDTKVRLAAALVVPFEAMTDDALVEMAFQFVDEDAVQRIVDERSHDRVALRGAYHCPACQDAGHVLGGDGRWYKCSRCNIVTEPPL